MPYAGKTLMARQLAGLMPEAETEDGDHVLRNRKVEGVAVILAESHGSIGAWHDNLAATSRQVVAEGLIESPWLLEEMTVVEARDRLHPWTSSTKVSASVSSRDCGLGQINIPARLIGTEAELKLRTDSLDEAVFMPVARANVNAIASLYAQPWVFPDGKREMRQWQAWVAVLTGWAFWAEWWVWHRDATGLPVGPWLPTGRYIQNAIRGVVNWHFFVNRTYGPPSPESARRCIVEGERLRAIYKVTTGTLFYDARQPERGIQWRVPPKPTEPPADPLYPPRSDGRSPIATA